MHSDDGTFHAIVYAFALALLAIIFLVNCLATPRRDFIPYEQQGYKSERARCDAKLRSYEYEDAAAHRAGGDQRTKDKRNQLCLQIRSVEAAEWSADYSRRQYFWTTMNAGFVAITTLAAIAAAIYAAGAVREGRRSANEAMRQANIAEDTFAKLERPVLHVNNLKLEKTIDDKHPLIFRGLSYAFENHGRSGCFVEHLSLGIFAGPKLPYPTPNFLVSRDEAGFVAPSQKWGNLEGTPMSIWLDATAKPFLAKGSAISLLDPPEDYWYVYVFGVIRYKAMNGHIWETSFAYRMKVDSDVVSTNFYPCPDRKFWTDERADVDQS